MPELLLELLSEEIPARLQARAADELKRLVASELDGAGLAHDSVDAHVTPRRLAVVVAGVPERQPDLREERRGPRVGAPDRAIEGFLKSCGVAREQCEERDTGKGVFLFAILERTGEAAVDVLPRVLAAAIGRMSWPKSMRWSSGRGRWIRPLQQVMCVFDGNALRVETPAAFKDAGEPQFATGGNETVGHRFLSPARFAVSDFADYRSRLADAHVILERARRKAMIRESLDELARTEGLVPRQDEALLDEVAGLVEWPVALCGRIDKAFMDVPDEVLTTSMRSHQKYFSLLDRNGGLAPRFVVIANIDTPDGGAAVIAGNERVLRARLSDAQFFWDQDRKSPLEARLDRLADSVFHEKLGTMAAKAARIERLARATADSIPGCDADAAARAARLAKADLATDMVFEFPELQGVMGRYYALHDGEDAVVADAVRDHYSPAGPGDTCPTAPVSVAVALADRLDTLAGFFAIGETPTGSRDPYALRRAALGIIRLVLENQLHLPFRALCRTVVEQARAADPAAADPCAAVLQDAGWIEELFSFVADRLKVHLRDRGMRHDHVAAAFAAGDDDDLLAVVARTRALAEFLASEDGSNLLMAHRRAGNIVSIEERKDGASHDGEIDDANLVQSEELTLAKELASAEAAAAAAIADRSYVDAMKAMAGLRAPVDRFFDEVTVNAEDPDLRANRLRLLSRFRATVDRIGDFSLIES